MDPNELIKHAPELLKGGAALAGALKFTDIIKAMLGPATAEIAERFHDDVRLYRYGRQLECLKKAEKMAKDAGFTPKAVPIKILFPLLEGASLEEDEHLHTMWATLLTNASNPNIPDLVRPSFFDVLRVLTPDVAKFLDKLFNNVLLLLERHMTPGTATGREHLVSFVRMFTTYPLGAEVQLFGAFMNATGAEVQSTTQDRYAIASDELIRLQLIRTTSRIAGSEYSFTAFGTQFVLACRAPAKTGMNPSGKSLPAYNR